MEVTQWNSVEYIKRPIKISSHGDGKRTEKVSDIIATVRKDGDSALIRYGAEFDNVNLDRLEVTEEELQAAERQCDKALLDDMQFGIERIEAFAHEQKKMLHDLDTEPLPGLHMGHKVIPLESAGCYVPGGRYPLLSSAQMTIIPARVAGVKEIYVCTPPKAHPAVLVAAHRSGATRIFRVGGAQAIAALAYGTRTVPAVSKIVGPGNAFVNEAKRQVFGDVGIDQLAGPSEIYVVADESGDAKIIAADLLGQAEHDVHARAGLITTSKELAETTHLEVLRQLDLLETAGTAREAWRNYGEIVVCKDRETLIAYSDHIAAEHLEVHAKDSHGLASQLSNYGSLFIGVEASVVYSDKVSGTNHTLPTGAAARYSGGLWVGSFVKTCTYQWLEPNAVEAIAPVCVRQSKREGLDGHRKAAEIRLNYDVV